MTGRVVRATFENSLGDLLAADRTFRATRASRWRDRVLGLVLVVVGAWSVAVGSALPGVLLAAVGVLIFLDLFPRPIVIWLAYRRTPALQGTWELEADDKGIGLRTVAGEVRTAWGGFSRIVESPRSFVLVAGGEMVGFVPKHALEPAELETFRELARAGVDAG